MSAPPQAESRPLVTVPFVQNTNRPYMTLFTSSCLFFYYPKKRCVKDEVTKEDVEQIKRDIM